MFTICRFTKAYIRSFTWTGSRTFFSSRSSITGERKKEKDVVGLSPSLRCVPTSSFTGCVPVTVRSLFPIEERKGRVLSFLSLNMTHTYTGFKVIFFPRILDECERAPTRLGSLFLSLFSSYLRDGYFFVSRFYMAPCGINLTCACFCCFSGYSVNLCSD